MKRQAKQIDTIIFTYPLWVEEFETPNSVQGEVKMSASGNHIAYQAEIRTPYITLASMQSGWISEDDVIAITALYNTLDKAYLLTYDDDSTELVRFAHEKGITFTPLVEGSCEFYVTINLAKV